MDGEEKTKEEKSIDKIQYPPYNRWHFTPKTRGDSFGSVKEIIISILNPLFKKEPFSQTGIYFSIFRYGESIELKVFAPEAFSKSIQDAIESFKNPSITIESGDGGSHFCTSNYCESENQEMEARKFLKDAALICCDLYQNDLAEAIKLTVKYEFIGNTEENTRPDIVKKIPEELKNFFRKNSPHYRSLEENKEDEKFWEGFCYAYNGKTPWNHWYYNPMVGLEYRPVPLYCFCYLDYLRSLERQSGVLIVPPQNYSCEEALAFHINKLMGNF